MSPVEKAAVAWWKSKRPVGWSKARHLRTYSVNTTTEAEHFLSKVVAKMLGEGK